MIIFQIDLDGTLIPPKGDTPVARDPYRIATFLISRQHVKKIAWQIQAVRMICVSDRQKDTSDPLRILNTQSPGIAGSEKGIESLAPE